MLCYVGHLLLLGKHLNLHLLLLWKRHEIVKYVFFVTLVNTRYFFAPRSIRIVEIYAIRYPVSFLRTTIEVAQVVVASEWIVTEIGNLVLRRLL